MFYNFGTFFRLLQRQFFQSKNTSYRLTPKRIKFLTIFLFLFYIPLEILTWIGFLLDDIFFRGYRKQQIRQPVFIVGNPRSGTTFIHRLMAKDAQHFTTMKTWEIVFAPSIIQRKLLDVLSAADRFIGSPVKRQLDRWEQRLVGQIETHKMGLREPEEDEYLFMHVCSSAVTWTFFPVQEEVQPYFYYDLAVPEQRRNKDMQFYARCLQKHLYYHGGNKQFLSKNPIFSSKIKSIKDTFPDAKIIYMARNPMSVVPSLVSYMAAGFHLFNDYKEKYPYCSDILDIVDFYYQYPQEVMAELPQRDNMVVDYDSLVADPDGTVNGVYTHLNLEMGDSYRETLKSETKKARKYRSTHEYSIADMGLSRQAILSRYSDAYQDFNFDPHLEEASQYDVYDVYYIREPLRRKKIRLPKFGLRKIRISKSKRKKPSGNPFFPAIRIRLHRPLKKRSAKRLVWEQKFQESI